MAFHSETATSTLTKHKYDDDQNSPMAFNICHSGCELMTCGYITEMTEHTHTEMNKLQWSKGLVIPAMPDSMTHSGKVLLRKSLARKCRVSVFVTFLVTSFLQIKVTLETK